ncbi:MAG: hypothetical protein RR382_00430 [Tannerellaceae bacterium]
MPNIPPPSVPPTPPPTTAPYVAPNYNRLPSYDEVKHNITTRYNDITDKTWGISPFLALPLAGSVLMGAGLGTASDAGPAMGAVRGLGAGVGGAVGARLGYKAGPHIDRLISPMIKNRYGVDLQGSPWWGVGTGMVGSVLGGGLGYRMTKKIVGKSPDELNNNRIGNTGTLVLRGR